jgi:hypothetical protein
MPSLTAAKIAPIINNYSIKTNKPTNIVIKNASKIKSIQQDVTVNGKLLPKQFVRLDKKTNKRSVVKPKGGTKYNTSPDGDLHFCLGYQSMKPHIACEVQNAKAFVSKFNQSIGKPISVSGFFRCLFEHPGFRSNDDAHIFEIHPVRAVSIGGYIQAFNVGIPDQKSIHTWKKPHDLNKQDNKIKVKYDKTKNTLTFTDMDGTDENYVKIQGTISKIKLNSKGTQPSSFTFTSKEVGHPVLVYCLHGTNAASQLAKLKKKSISMIALRNIDLVQAFNNKYVINLLAIDIKG